MIELRIALSDLQHLRNSLLGHNHERCAILFAGRGHCRDGRELILVREIILPTNEDYTKYGYDHAQLRPEFVARIAKHARLNELSLIFVHTHPGDTVPQFSRVDDHGEEELAAFLFRRGQIFSHAAIVLSEGGMSARLLGQHKYIRVISVGDKRRVEFDPETKVAETLPMFDRQVRAFGEEGQSILNSLCVAIVGLGGTGSIAAQQLVHLGIHKFILIDPDSLEPTNLNRVVGSVNTDIQRSKCEIAAQYIQKFSPNAKVQAMDGDVVYETVARHLINADIIFCCTDSHGSRSVIQQIVYQYLIPCIDIGSTISTAEGMVTGIYGRVQLLGPDQPCLWCSELLNPEEVRRDMMNESERQTDPYFRGTGVPAPSVISLNGTVVSLGITMMLGLVTSMPVDSRYLIYNALMPSLRSIRSSAIDDCFICSRSGAYGRGDAQLLFARKD